MDQSARAAAGPHRSAALPAAEAVVLTAPADGVAPAVLLTLGGAGPRGAQYLFSAPEGLSRLALEHRLRPGARLRALLAPDAGGAVAGAGGLLMRLRGEGHGRLHVVGPPGTQAALTSLRHFICWWHPALLLCEISEWEQTAAYERRRDCGRRQQQQQSGAFAQLDALLAARGRGAGDSRELVFEQLRVAAVTAAAAASGSTPQPQQVDRQQQRQQQLARRGPPPKRRRTVSAAAAAPPPLLPPAPAAPAPARDELYEVGGRLFRPLPLPGISAYAQHKLSQHKLPSSAGDQAGGGGQQREALGFLCHLKASDQLLLVTHLPSMAAAAALAQHPALPALRAQGARLAAALHAVPPAVAASRQFNQLARQLPPQRQAVLEQPWPLAQQRGREPPQQARALGHLATASTSARLNLVSPRVFPLPQPLAALRAASDGGELTGSGGTAGTETADCGADWHQRKQEQEQEQDREGRERREQEELTNGQVRSEDQQQSAESEEPAGSAADVKHEGGASRDALATVRCITHLSWQQQSERAAGSAAEPSSPPALVLWPAEVFASPRGFDVAAKQQEALEQRPELRQQLGLLAERQQPLLALLHAPPPLQPRCPRPAIAKPPAPPPEQQQQPPEHGSRLGRVMKPLYSQPGPSPTPQLQQPRNGVMPLGWALGPGPLLVPPVQQLEQPALATAPPGAGQQQGHASNKGAAAALRARLKGAAAASSQVEPPAPPVPPPAPPESQQQQQASSVEARPAAHEPTSIPAWLRGAPPCLQRLALSAAPAACGSGTGAGGAAVPGAAGVQAAARELAAATAAAAATATTAAAAAAAAALGDGCPEVTFLGTGSAEPSKYRGPSAIHLRLACGRGLLLDCGEGTLGQLVRMHGHRAAQRLLAGLACVWVSHRHADHMAGVLPLLAALPAGAPPLLVVGPGSLQSWLAEAAPAAGAAGRYCFVHCCELRQPGHWAHGALCSALGLTSLTCVAVRHCTDAWALVLRSAQGWSLAYSGDTQPCEALVQAARGVTLLVHEATFEPCLAQQAAKKRHSTTAEALDVAQRMGAYRTILTHFSQRYPKWPEGVPMPGDDDAAVPPGQAEGSRRRDGEGGQVQRAAGEHALAAYGVAVAFDGMRVPLALLPALPLLMPAVRAALAEQEEEEQQDPGGGTGAGAGEAEAEMEADMDVGS
eukprot:scaffold2.g7427.t1